MKLVTITPSPVLAQAVHDASEWLGSLIEPTIYGVDLDEEGRTRVGFAVHQPDDDWRVQWGTLVGDALRLDADMLTITQSKAAEAAAAQLGARSWIVTKVSKELADPSEPQWGYVTRLCLLLDGERIQWGSMCEGDLLLDDID